MQQHPRPPRCLVTGHPELPNCSTLGKASYPGASSLSNRTEEAGQSAGPGGLGTGAMMAQEERRAGGKTQGSLTHPSRPRVKLLEGSSHL